MVYKAQANHNAPTYSFLALRYRLGPTARISVELSFMQLYMEHVSDLLDPLFQEKADQRVFDEAFCARGTKDEGMPHVREFTTFSHFGGGKSHPLSLTHSTKSLPIREDKKKGVFVEGLTKLKVNSAKEVLDAIRGAAQYVFRI